MWPEALENYEICTNLEQDKLDRAESIMNYILDVYLEDLKFLDFGCGEGHIANLSLSQNPNFTVGYDITVNEHWATWEADPRLVFTDQWEVVEKNGPYNVILLCDVIDHMMGEKGVVVEALRKIRQVMAPNARVFVRCHPWTSRHATHLHHKINKAFVHLVFTEEELAQLGYTDGLPTQHIIHPLKTYGEFFNEAAFRIQNKEQLTKVPIEDFFSKTPIIAQRIKKNYINSHDNDLRDGKRFPSQLEVQFVDYVLV